MSELIVEMWSLSRVQVWLPILDTAVHQMEKYSAVELTFEVN